MDEFVLIFRHEDASGKVSPEQIQTWMKLTMDWLGGIAAQNKLVSNGNGLSFADSRVVSIKELLPMDHLVKSKKRSADMLL